jgi:hypothetical protein
MAAQEGETARDRPKDLSKTEGELQARATVRSGNLECKTLSRKGPWRLSRTLATQTGMTNQWLKDQGLVSVKELWVKTCPAIVFQRRRIHYPTTAS